MDAVEHKKSQYPNSCPQIIERCAVPDIGRCGFVHSKPLKGINKDQQRYIYRSLVVCVKIYQQTEQCKEQGVHNIEDRFIEQSKQLQEKMRRYSAITDLVMRHHARKNIPYSRQAFRRAFDNMSSVLEEIEIIIGGISYHAVKHKYKAEHKRRNSDYSRNFYYRFTIHG